MIVQSKDEIPDKTILRTTHLSKLWYFTSRISRGSGRISSPRHYNTEEEYDDEDADGGLYLEAASVLGVRMPETRPLVKWTAAALAPGAGAAEVVRRSMRW